MCYAIPARVLDIDGDDASVDWGGIVKKVNVSLVDGLKVGDYVLIHAGFAIERLNQRSAEESLKIIMEDLAQFSADEMERPKLR
jgi:hydrogenase expression/formation protein HypC